MKQIAKKIYYLFILILSAAVLFQAFKAGVWYSTFPTTGIQARIYAVILFILIFFAIIGNIVGAKKK